MSWTVILNCQFCNCIVACEKGSKAAFIQHMEAQHNIFQEHDLVLAIHFLGEEKKTEILRKAQREILEKLGIGTPHEDLEEEIEEEEEAEIRIFNYPRLEAAPHSKDWNLAVLRRQISKYLALQGFGRNMKRLGQGKQPIGWPEQKYKWSEFKGTGRGCSKQMLEDIIFALLQKQNINPAEYVEGALVETTEEEEEEALVENVEKEAVVESSEKDHDIEVDIMVDTNEDEELHKKQSELEARLRVAVNELHNEDSVEGFEQREAKKSKTKKTNVEVPRRGKRVKKPTKDFFDFVK